MLATAGSSTDFTLQTSVKGGKTYQLRAPSAPVRTEWIEALTKVIEASGTKMDQMGDNGLAEEEEAEPEPSAEDLAKIEQEKYAPHALSPLLCAFICSVQKSATRRLWLTLPACMIPNSFAVWRTGWRRGRHGRPPWLRSALLPRPRLPPDLPLRKKLRQFRASGAEMTSVKMSWR